MNATPDPTGLTAAKARAGAARARLGGTIAVLKQRVSPQALAQDAADTLKDKGVALAHDLADGAKRRPAVFAAIAGGVALVFGRRRIARLLRRATGTAAGRLSSKPVRKGPVE